MERFTFSDVCFEKDTFIVACKRKATFWIVISLVIALIVIRAYLPIWLTDYVNKEINELDGYGGSVENIDIHLLRGAYQIHKLDIYKTKGGLNEPFVAAEVIDLSIEWSSLWHGIVVAEADIYNAGITFGKSQTGQGAGWVKFIDSLSPFDINRVEVHSGKVAYKDYAASPDINLYINDIHALITNIRNTEEKEVALPSDINITGTSIGGGNLELNGNMNAIKDPPDFDMGLSISNADLTALNDYAQEWAAIDFQEGNIGIYGELAAANGNVTGYVKPVANNISLIDVSGQDKNPFDIIWESFASIFIELFENQPTDQFAMRIPIEGNLKQPDRDMWSGFLSIFKNAFSGAFSQSEDGSVKFNDAMILHDEN